MGPPATSALSCGTSTTARVRAPKWERSRFCRSLSTFGSGADSTVTARRTASSCPVARSASSAHAADCAVSSRTVETTTIWSAAATAACQFEARMLLPVSITSTR